MTSLRKDTTHAMQYKCQVCIEFLSFLRSISSPHRKPFLMLHRLCNFSFHQCRCPSSENEAVFFLAFRNAASPFSKVSWSVVHFSTSYLHFSCMLFCALPLFLFRLTEAGCLLRNSKLQHGNFLFGTSIRHVELWFASFQQCYRNADVEFETQVMFWKSIVDFP